MTTMFDDVHVFRKTMQLPIGDAPHLLRATEVSYFARFIMEELSEFLRANEEGNLVKAADALVDLTYVAMGGAHAMGLPFNDLWKVVHAANMRKQPATALYRSVRGNQYDVVKPAGWVAPEATMQTIIDTHIKLRKLDKHEHE
jgi:predicted HAD superfamily Cof-like phosphohydrolase